MDNVIREDTPAGTSEDLQWKIDKLVEMNASLKEELEKERKRSGNYAGIANARRDNFNRLVSRLTIGALREAGIRVDVTVPDEYDD